MDYICQHCRSNLDAGDIYQHFLLTLGDHKKAIESATAYGWSETDKIHFNRSVIVQPTDSEQYIVCPDCNKRDPFGAEIYH
jgi:DNA-directed RNA polymerase subunit RPC12/RpoP